VFEIAKKAARAEPLYVKSKVKEYVRSLGCNTSGVDLAGGALNDIVKEILDKAIARAKANGRKTVTAKDL